jgi:hypothetical protein
MSRSRYTDIVESLQRLVGNEVKLEIDPEPSQHHCRAIDPDFHFYYGFRSSAFAHSMGYLSTGSHSDQGSLVR